MFRRALHDDRTSTRIVEETRFVDVEDGIRPVQEAVFSEDSMKRFEPTIYNRQTRVVWIILHRR